MNAKNDAAAEDPRSGLTAEQLTRLGEKLRVERDALGRRLTERRAALTRASTREPDESDWASSSADQSLMARLTDRDSKLLREIDHALRKLTTGEFGICEESGDPIGFDRLWVRPWARKATAVKERTEQEEARGQSSGFDSGRLESEEGDDDYFSTKARSIT